MFHLPLQLPQSLSYYLLLLLGEYLTWVNRDVVDGRGLIALRREEYLP